MRKIRPIYSENEYESALKRIESLWGAKRGTSQGVEFELLLVAIESWEREHYPIPLGLTRSDPVCI